MKHIFLFVMCACMMACVNRRAERAEKSRLLQMRLEQSFEKKLFPSIQSDPPLYYEGSYVDEDGILVIRVAGDTVSACEDIKQRIGEHGFKIELSWYSSQKINEANAKLVKFMQTVPRDFLIGTLKWYSISPGPGYIKIGLGDCSPENIELFKRRIMDSPMLVFEKKSIAVAD